MIPSIENPIYPHKGASLFGLCIAWIAISTLFVTLRVWSRLVLRTNKIDWDDWTALAAWPFVVALEVIGAVMFRSGFGRHVRELSPHSQQYCLKLYFAVSLMYYSGIGLIRISALLFYRRVFQNHTKWFKYNFQAALAINIIWIFSFYMYTIFGCTPVRASWDRSIPHKCIDKYDGQLSNGITSAILDVWLLVIPMPLLWRLSMTAVRRVSLTGIFFLGYGVVIMSIGRTIAISRTRQHLVEDFTYAFTTSAYWYACELFFAFVSICLPGVVSLLKRAKRHGFKALFTDADYYLDIKAAASLKSGHRSVVVSSVDIHRPIPLTQLPKTYSTDREELV